jgi:hypothetical protein
MTRHIPKPTRPRRMRSIVVLVLLVFSVSLLGAGRASADVTNGNTSPPSTPSHDLDLSVWDWTGTRHLDYFWVNRTGSAKCFKATRWESGNPVAMTDVVTVQPNGNAQHILLYSGFYDATLTAWDCATGVINFRYLIGLGSNPNKFLVS